MSKKAREDYRLGGDLYTFLQDVCSEISYRAIVMHWAGTSRHAYLVDYVKEHRPDVWFKFLAWRAVREHEQEKVRS